MKFLKELETIKNEEIIQIANYLLTRDDIKNNLEKENKSLEEMWQYINQEMLNEYVKKNGSKKGIMGWTDAKVYALAVHYYDEDDIKVESKTTENVKVQAATMTDIKKLSKPVKKSKVAEGQLTLFDAIGD